MRKVSRIFKKSRLNGSVKSVQRTFAARAPEWFVVDVGNIHHSMDFEAARFEMPLAIILENCRPEISMWHGCKPWAAGVDRDIGRIARRELLQKRGVGIEKRIILARSSSRAKSRIPREADR